MWWKIISLFPDTDVPTFWQEWTTQYDAQNRLLGTFVFISVFFSHPAQTDSSGFLFFFFCLSSRLPILPSSTPQMRKPLAFTRSTLFGSVFVTLVIGWSGLEVGGRSALCKIGPHTIVLRYPHRSRGRLAGFWIQKHDTVGGNLYSFRIFKGKTKPMHLMGPEGKLHNILKTRIKWKLFDTSSCCLLEIINTFKNICWILKSYSLGIQYVNRCTVYLYIYGMSDSMRGAWSFENAEKCWLSLLEYLWRPEPCVCLRMLVRLLDFSHL